MAQTGSHQDLPDEETEQIDQNSGSLSTISLENEPLVQSLAATESFLAAPIDINVARAQQINLPPLEWLHYEAVPASIKLTNNGETVILSARWDGPDRPTITGGSLTGRYVFSQLHFHWSDTALEGSEHTVDGAHLPLELHVIHYDNRYGSQDEAQSIPGGLLCLVYFFALKSRTNHFIAPLINALATLALPESHTKLEPFPLIELFHPFTVEYFLYWGSIVDAAAGTRTPILWMLSRLQESIKFQQLKQFNRLLDSRMRRPRDQPKTPLPTSVASIGGRHLFHVNPRTPMAVATLAIEPPEKYGRSRERWLADRMVLDWSTPDACRRFVQAMREELAKKREQEVRESDAA
ncbi:carbonic anhydrase 2-like [Anopheles aquasalis]|uniref:carbonic anhydrase 2-like n=1 Tax=Anopheles aquasalis TaxID=42839 RepID=UPI00215AF2BD|nr:carbonic anhydrase 2-like [Anopheles aquasalis]